MFVLFDENTKFPIKIWASQKEDIEESCIEQAYHLANLPFLHKWVCLMPDTHTGKGMPIGGVIAAKNVIIPNAVGSDIGCGMAFIQTNIKACELKNITTGSGSLLQCIVGDILRNIPVGFSHFKTKQNCKALDNAFSNLSAYEKQTQLIPELEEAYYQIGTLGGGNHFIELQEDEKGYLAIMIHTGSRHLGNQVCNYFHNKARELNTLWHSNVPDEYRLAFLPTESQEGKDYINWMNLCLNFAHENRLTILNSVKHLLEKQISKYTGQQIQYSQEIHCHHNYASLETHYNQEVWIHRKGAVRAQKGEQVIIPGAMGSYSYIAEGLGNEMSFYSSSHGAGRQYSRKGAMERFSCEEVIVDLKKNGIILGKSKKSDVAEESRFAYKDIDTVLSNEQDLVKPIKKLKTIGVVKG